MRTASPSRIAPAIACVVLICTALIVSKTGNHPPSSVGTEPTPGATSPYPSPMVTPTQSSPVPGPPAGSSTLPGMPPVTDARNIYSNDGANALSPTVASLMPLLYVPNSISNNVDVVNPATRQVVAHFPVGGEPQHIVPSYDLKTLYVTSDRGNSLTPINAATAQPGPPIPVTDPYNLYFTPDGKFAIVVAEAFLRLDFREPTSFALIHSLNVPCAGVDHMDFSADGRYLIASCEFGGNLIKVDVAAQSVVASVALPPLGGRLAQPQDVKLSPDGKTFYVADMTAGGVYKIDGDSMTIQGFVPTGKNAHGLYVSRDSQVLYVSDRGEGAVSVISFASQSVVATWRIPGGGSPDMGGVSADGKVLWLSGRYNSEIYGFDTTSGNLIARIGVGNGPHGMCVYPQPGRYSLGHTGILR